MLHRSIVKAVGRIAGRQAKADLRMVRALDILEHRDIRTEAIEERYVIDQVSRRDRIVQLYLHQDLRPRFSYDACVTALALKEKWPGR